MEVHTFVDGPQGGRDCVPLEDEAGSFRCALLEGADYTINYADPACASGVSIELGNELVSSCEVEVSYQAL